MWKSCKLVYGCQSPWKCDGVCVIEQPLSGSPVGPHFSWYPAPGWAQGSRLHITVSHRTDTYWSLSGLWP